MRVLESLRGWRGDLYYGWVIVVACNLVACITWGVAIFNQGVFVAYYASTFGWSPAALSLAPVLFHLCAGVVGVVVGRVVDRSGPRPALYAGALLISMALLGLAAVREVWHVYPAFLLLGAGFACIHTVTLGKIVSRWFLRQRSRAMAAATFGAGIGGAVLVPLNVVMIENYGLLEGSLTLIAITLVVVLPVALFVIKDGPEAMGLPLDGRAAAVAGMVAERSVDAREARNWSVADAMRTVAFWALAVCFGFGMLAQSAYLFHQVSFLQSSLGLLGAASVVTVTTLAGIAGRVTFILVGDRLTPRGWTAAVFLLQAAAFVVLAFAEEPVGLTLGSTLFGLTMGVMVTLQPVGVAYMFGSASFGRVFGPIYMSIRLGSALGPAIVGMLVVLGGYGTAWLAVAASLAIAILVLPWALLPAGARLPSAKSVAWHSRVRSKGA